MPLLALDIGGANLKAADGRGFAIEQPFALWKAPHLLGPAITTLLSNCPPADRLAITMTGELCDCFPTKRDGVHSILGAVRAAADGRICRVYLTDGSLVSLDEACERPLEAAASNWHALASAAAQMIGQRSGMLLDIGSTTTDMIPLSGGHVIAQGRTDPERLASGELLYTGVMRSPLCALVDELPWRGTRCSVAQELFATTWDAYLTLGDLPEQPQRRDTADGRPATVAAAHARLARAICADTTMFDALDASAAAQAVAAAQQQRIGVALQRVTAAMPRQPEVYVISGSGAFLARRAIMQLDACAEVISLSDLWGDDCAQAAAAHALALLADNNGIVFLPSPLVGKGPGVRGWKLAGLCPTLTRHVDCGCAAVGMPPSPIEGEGEGSGVPTIATRVVKIGGSLLELPDLADRLDAWLATQSAARNICVVGGGQLADGVRQLDQQHRLPTELSHRLALRTMTMNAELVAALWRVPLITALGELWPTVHSEARAVAEPVVQATVIIFDAWQFATEDEPRLPGERLPIGWQVTSDSIAARLAEVLGAEELVLLKSAPPPAHPTDIASWAASGYVDEHFASAAEAIPRVKAVDLTARRSKAAERV